MSTDPEALACQPVPVNPRLFNSKAKLPYGCTIKHLGQAMAEFTSFLGFINQQLYTKKLARLEAMLMPANFSSMVGEFMSASIPKYCPGLVKNRYHNGHPDLLPANRFTGDSLQHGCDGIEIKGSRYSRGWQGHNPEDCWLMVFVFDSNRPIDANRQIPPRPFEFRLVAGARLTKTDWLFAGRSATSRRTITASVTPTGYKKMLANWIYSSAPIA
jgi:hypothetical protein